MTSIHKPYLDRVEVFEIIEETPCTIGKNWSEKKLNDFFLEWDAVLLKNCTQVKMSSTIENVDATVTVPTVSYADVFETVKSNLNSKELYKLGRDLLTFLEKQEPKGKKKRVRDPNAPKKEANWFMNGCSNVIGAVIKAEYYDADSKTWKDEDAKIATINTRVGGILRNRGQFSKEGVIPNKSQILDAFTYYKANKETILAEIEAKKAAVKSKKEKPVAEAPKVVTAETPKVVVAETPKKAEKVAEAPGAPVKEKKEKKEKVADVPKMVLEEKKEEKVADKSEKKEKKDKKDKKDKA